MKKRIALLLAAVMVLSMVACGGKKEEAPAEAPAEETEAPAEEAEAPAEEAALPKVGFIPQALANASQAYAWTQFQKLAPEYGVEVTVFDEDYDPQNGVAAIGTCVAQGYAAVVCCPSDPSALVPAIMEAREAGVLVGLYSSELPEEYANTDYRDFMCGTNDFLFGQMAAQTVMEAFPDGCNVIEVGGQSGHSAQILRHDGFVDIIDGTNVTLLDTKDCEQWATEDAQAITEDFIVKYGDQIDVVYCHWDGGATGVINALKDAGMNDVYVIGVDGSSVGFDQVKEGTQALCIGQNFTTMTHDALTCITTLLKGEALESDVVFTAPDVITAETIDNFPYPEW